MLAPSRAGASTRFLDWLESMDREGRIFLSVVTVHEVERGIAQLEHKGAAAKAAGLRVWLAGLVAAYEDKILGVDARAASFAGRLEAKALAAGHDPGMADAVIAGIAGMHNLVIVTGNVRHFLPFVVSAATPDEVIEAT